MEWRRVPFSPRRAGAVRPVEERRGGGRMRYARLTDVKKESTMRIAIRHALALAAVVLALAWARPAQAQVTITGVVGEVAAFANAPGMGAVIRFKLTDA